MSAAGRRPGMPTIHIDLEVGCIADATLMNLFGRGVFVDQTGGMARKGVPQYRLTEHEIVVKPHRVWRLERVEEDDP